MIVAFILFIGIVLSGVIFIIYENDSDKNGLSAILGAACTLIWLICGGAASEYTHKSEPTALDVYQGKTTLQITYQDSIPVDSIVIYKNDIKCN